MINRRTVLVAAATAAFLPIGVYAAPRGTLYKTPGCECCDGHARHLRSFGFDLRIVESDALDAVKAVHGVPEDLAGCHTIVVGDLVIEGHVPGDLAAQFLAKPGGLTGIALAGMPDGSPGMGGRKTEVFKIIGFGPQGRRLYATR